MIESLTLIGATVAGAALGTAFFGGLWWTVRLGPTSRSPALWFVCSLLLRTAIALSGLYAVSGGHWNRLLACLVGFTVARFLVTWLTRPSGDSRERGTVQVSNAP